MPLPTKTLSFRAITGLRFDLTTTNNSTASRWVVDVSGYTSFTVQSVSIGDAAWSTGVITVYRSNDGTNVAALETALTITAAGMKNEATIKSHKFLVFQTTTAEASVYADLTLHLVCNET